MGALCVFPWIFSFSDLINSQCFTYHFYVEDSNCTFLDTQSLYWAKQGVCDILTGGGKHGSRDPCRQESGSLEAESKILDRSLVVRELVRKKEKQDFLKTQGTRQGLGQRNRFWARALFKIGGQRQRGTSFQADMMSTFRGSDLVLKFYPTSLPSWAELLHRSVISSERTEPSKPSQLRKSRSYLSSKLEACDELRRCRPDVPNLFSGHSLRQMQILINPRVISLLIAAIKLTFCPQNCYETLRSQGR